MKLPRRGEPCNDWIVTCRTHRISSVLAVGATLVACQGASREKAPAPPAVESTVAGGGKLPPNPQHPSPQTTPPPASAGVPSPPTESSSAPEGDFAGTVGTAEVRRQGPPVTLVSVRLARHPSFDRVVFEYDKAVPGYRVEYVDRPIRQCGSGDSTPVAGDAWLMVKTHPANAHTEAGNPTIPWREQKAELGVLREIERICDFEAEVTHVLGVGSPNHYRVLELSAPPRLVVDVRHGK